MIIALLFIFYVAIGVFAMVMSDLDGHTVRESFAIAIFWPLFFTRWLFRTFWRLWTS